MKILPTPGGSEPKPEGEPKGVEPNEGGGPGNVFVGTLTKLEVIVDADSTAEMPRYKSHKEVWALKIANIERHNERDPNAETDGSALLTPCEEGYAPIRVDQAYMRKHQPQVGGYYVVYKDGYKSFSPAEAFEDGYTRV